MASQNSFTLTCNYCKSSGHNKYSCPVLKDKKKKKKDQQYWDRLFTNWGTSDEALESMYEQGDVVYGKGFKAYMESISIFRDVIPSCKEGGISSIFDNLSLDEPECENDTVNVYKAEEPKLRWAENIGNNEAVSLKDIMKEQSVG
mgnify:FL=1